GNERRRLGMFAMLGSEMKRRVSIDTNRAIDLTKRIGERGETCQLCLASCRIECRRQRQPFAELHAEAKVAAGPESAVRGDQREDMVAARRFVDMVINGGALGQVGQSAGELRRFCSMPFITSVQSLVRRHGSAPDEVLGCRENR